MYGSFLTHTIYHTYYQRQDNSAICLPYSCPPPAYAFWVARPTTGYYRMGQIRTYSADADASAKRDVVVWCCVGVK